MASDFLNMELRKSTTSGINHRVLPKRLKDRRLKCVLATGLVNTRKKRKPSYNNHPPPIKQEKTPKEEEETEHNTSASQSLDRVDPSATPPHLNEPPPPTPSTRTQKTYRRLARQKQLEQMKSVEQTDQRRMRYLKRQRHSGHSLSDDCQNESVDGCKKHVQWCNEVTFHSYTPECSPS